MMMYSNAEEGDIIHFKFFDGDDNKWYSYKETLNFESDMVIANAYHPFELRNAIADDFKEDGYNINVYPNPFRESLNYSFTLNEDGNVFISVINTSGSIIEVLKNQVFLKGVHTFEWNNANLIEGMYYLRFEMKGVEKTIPIIKTN